MTRSRLTPLTLRRPTLARLVRDARGATMVEYALVLSLILVAGAPAVRLLGQRVTAGFQAVAATFSR